MAKKTQEPKAPEEVINTTELTPVETLKKGFNDSVDAIHRGVDNVFADPKRRSFVAFAPFDLGGKHYEAGDAFSLPDGFVSDENFETFRGQSHKNKGPDEDISLAFIDPTGKRAILPVKEA